MPDGLIQALALPGLGWLILAVLIAGTVRGFSGFGTALIYLPVAGMFLPPVWTLITLVTMDIIGPLPHIRGALRAGHPRDLMRLMVGTAIGLPIGLAVLYVLDPMVFRYGVSACAIGMLVILAAGVRYRGPLNPPLIYGTGVSAGFLGGVAGLPGPPVILLYMASTLGSAIVRANTLAYLFFFDLFLLGLLFLQGRLDFAPLWVGVILIVPNLIGVSLGAWLFNPEKEKIYRAVAYTVIAASAITGLPIWS